MVGIKDKKVKLSIIVPCYNEEKNIHLLYSELNPALRTLQKSFDVEAIFVDDGSADNTYGLLQKYFGKMRKSKILKHKKNIGVGAAIRTGFKEALGDFVVTIDGDCSYKPSEIPNLLKLLENGADLVTASPYHPTGSVGNVVGYKLFLSKAISFIYRFLTRKKIYTYTAIFRAYKRNVIKNVKFQSNDFMATAEMLIKALYLRYKVKEYPITLYERRYGSSKLKVLHSIISHLKLIFNILTKRL